MSSLYQLIGHPLGHSLSPFIHERLFTLSGAEGRYTLKDLSPDSFEAEAATLLPTLAGGNVTIPYKQRIVPLLDRLDGKAALYRTVNTFKVTREETVGYNTDADGFLAALREADVPLKGQAVLLGSGGAATVFACEAALAGCQVTLYRPFDTASAEALCERVNGLAGRTACRIEDRFPEGSVDLLLNATPVGMYPKNGERLVDLSIFPHLSGVLDVIYNPYKTALILDAEERGIPSAGGLRMLVAQAVVANEMFFSEKQDKSVIDAIEKKVAAMMKNVTLIGMPGCGKSTIGKRLAALTGRELVDIDAEIVKVAGKTIPEIFAEDGEEAFRRLETQVTAEVCKRSGCIISCGGGVVTRPENRRLIRQNSTVVFIARELDTLATKGRPLSETTSALSLWEARRPMYNSWSDIKMLNCGINQTALAIIRALHLNTKKRT